MAKLNIEVNVTGAKDVKTLEKALKQLETSSSKVETQNKKTTKSMKSMVVQSALVIGAIYAIQKAMRAAITEGFSYNNSLEQATTGLIALSVVAQDKAIPVIDRYANATREATYTLAELQKINAETPHTLNQTNAIYKAMYISMRRVGATTDEMINLTKKLSIASGAAGIEFNALLAGVDGLASGSVLANSDLGRFLNGLGLTNEKLKETKDVVGLVTEALEDFEAADTMSVAVSNLNNVWSIFAGNITKPIFHGTKNAMNEISKMMSKQSPEAMQIFSDAMVDMANAGVKSIGFVLKAVNQLIGLLETSYAGYIKLAGLLQGGSISELNKEIMDLQKIQKDGDYGLFSNQSYKIVNDNIKAKREEIKEIEKANALRREGERIQEKAVQRTEAINKLINDGIKKIKINYGKVGTEVKNLSKPLETVFKSIDPKQDKKTIKAAEKNAKKLRKAYEKEADKLNDMFESIGQTLGESITGAMGPVASELYKFYNTVMALMAQTSAASQAESAVNGKEAEGPAIAKSGELAGPYGAMAMAAILALYGMGTGGAFNTEVSQADIDASMGRTEFDDESLAALGDIYQDAQYPMLKVTKKMHDHIRNMDTNFYAIARSFSNQASAGGVDLTGANIVDTFEEGFLGFSSKTASLIGSGLKFEIQSLGEVMDQAELNVRSYTTKLVEESSWFGLVQSTKIEETYKNLPPEVIDSFSKTFAQGYETIMTAGVSLGMDRIDLSTALQKAEIDMGKIDFTGLSQEEIQNRLSDAFSTAFSGVVETIPELTILVERYNQGIEKSLETLGRITLEHDQASHSFDLLGKTFRDGMTKTLVTTTQTIEETSTSWFSKFSFLNKKLSNTYERTITTMVDTTYTAQMQILDIVKSTGGITEFNDAMAAYMDLYFEDGEKAAFLTKSMAKAFSTLNIEMPKTNKEFRSLLEGFDTSTEEGAYLYGQLLLLAEGFNTMTEATNDLAAAGKDMVRDYADSISSLLLGTYSNLSIAGKQEFAKGYSEIAAESAGTLSSIDAARAEMETAFKYATTQEEYGVYVDRLVSQLRDQAPEATNDDIVERLDILIEETHDMNETLKMTS